MNNPLTTEGSGGATELIAALRVQAADVAVQSGRRAEIVDVAARQEADDRSMITRWVMRGFGTALVCIFVLLVAKAIMTGDWAAAVDQALDVLKTVILPIVTLVLGYYFGRAAKGS